MSIRHEKDWDNYWQGRAAKASGEALIGVGIENNAKLSAFWTDLFKGLAPSARIADFACGAGSAIKHAHAAGLFDLTGVDIAAQAIDVLKTAIPNVKGCVSPVDDTPFEAGSFDAVVSQFGFEYAGDGPSLLAAAQEMARVLAPGGTFTAITHIQGGAIEQESAASLANINLVLESGFISSAHQMFKAVYTADTNPTAEHQHRFRQALIVMNQAESQLVQWLKSPQAQGNEFARFGHYLVTSTREMFARHSELSLEDCLTWLDEMQAEILAYQGRMRSMVEAAISKNMAENVLAVFSKAGFTVDKPEPFYFDPEDLPVAWVLRGEGKA